MKDWEYLLLPPLTNVMALRESDVYICQVELFHYTFLVFGFPTLTLPPNLTLPYPTLPYPTAPPDPDCSLHQRCGPGLLSMPTPTMWRGTTVYAYKHPRGKTGARRSRSLPEMSL